MNQNLIFSNGLNAATGDYGLPPMTGEELWQFVHGEAKPENLEELRLRQQKSSGAKGGQKRIDRDGWGVIFSHKADPAIKEALSPLLDLRKKQAGKYFKVFEGSDGYRPAESKTKFLKRHDVGPGPPNPIKVPYYLLIVGGPDIIPFRFQTQIDVQYSVGRIAFDTVEAYANYAQSVVDTELGIANRVRRIALFGVTNNQDQATQISTKHLVDPVLAYLQANTMFPVNSYLGDRATKAQLAQLLGGDDTPMLLFTSSHGVEFPIDDPRQLPHQGALLCQDWPGPLAWRGQGSIPQDFYFAGDDIDENADLRGLIAFHFACYSAGTPLNDEFSRKTSKAQKQISSIPFLANLPQRMLSHPNGGALAVVGHVERTWSHSFFWEGAGSQTTVFERMLKSLLNGEPVGSAVDHFNERYAELSTVLSDELGEIDAGKEADPYEMAHLWIANNDARGYIVIGDPAVKLSV